MPHLPARLRTRRGALLAIGGGVIGLLVVAFLFVYFVLFATSSPKKFSLSSSAAGAPVSSASQLSGQWTVAPGSRAGYRVREKLAFLPAESDAVGRTSAITGAATVSGSASTATITAAAFTVDVSMLTSDQAMRDQHIRTIGLQSDTYPKATFKLTAPLTIPPAALAGHVADTSVTGVFTIHGTSRTETVPVQMTVSTSAIDTVGSLTFPWGDFGMTAPSVGGFVSVTDKATMEFDLHLKPA